MAAYIDLNPVRAGIVKDPKDYRFCGYVEAVANLRQGLGRQTSAVGSTDSQQTSSSYHSSTALASEHVAVRGILQIWCAYANGIPRESLSVDEALQAHRELIFGKWLGEPGLSEAARQQALKVLEEEDAILPMATVLRCRVRYFFDGAILGSQEFVREFVGAWQKAQGRKYPPKVNPLRGADWQGMATIRGLRKQVFG